MQALVKETPGPGLCLRDVPEPAIVHPDEVLFEVVYCAICVGETKVYDWNEWAANDQTLQLPTVIGHEAVGIVKAVGPEVTQFKPGDRIVNDPLIYCGHCRQCRQCRSGFTNMCDNREIYGKRRGAFAEYAVLSERVLCPLNAQLSLEEGAVLENLGIAMHAVDVKPHDPGDWAVIIGAGPIGVLAAQILAAWGVKTVITNLVEGRLDFARRHSRAVVVDVKREDPVQHMLELTKARGADFVVEMVANQAAMDQAFDMVRTRGTVVTISTFDAPTSFNPFFKMARLEIRLQSIMGRTWESWRRMEGMIDAGLLDLRPLVTHILPLEEYRRGFELVKSQATMKVLLEP